MRARDGAPSARGVRPCALLLARIFLVAASAAAFASTPASVQAKTIAGTVMTADHPDSVVPHAPVTLIFREGESGTRRLEEHADPRGHFHFQDLAPDTSVDYVLSIDFRGRQFLSAPIRFRPDQDLVEFNVLLTAGFEAGQMPQGHPPMEPERPRFGRAVRSDPLHTVLLVLGAAGAFAGLGWLARRRSTGLTQADLPAQARALIRDIASLDNSFQEGILGEEEYRKVRDGLMERLRKVEKDAGRTGHAADPRVPAGRA